MDEITEEPAEEEKKRAKKMAPVSPAQKEDLLMEAEDVETDEEPLPSDKEVEESYDDLSKQAKELKKNLTDTWYTHKKKSDDN